MTKTSATAVSRVLRNAGARPVPANGRLWGTSVSRDLNGAKVVCSYETDAISLRHAADVTDTLISAGYVVRVNPHDATILYVAK